MAMGSVMEALKDLLYLSSFRFAKTGGKTLFRPWELAKKLLVYVNAILLATFWVKLAKLVQNI